MVEESKEIYLRQNQAGLINAQKAASYCYLKGKKLSVILVCLLIAFPIIVNVVLLFVKNDIVSATLAVVLFLDFVAGQIIKFKINKAKFYGACLQQYFDERVFNLKNSSRKYLAPEKLSPPKIAQLIIKYQDKDSLPFTNWYSDYSTLPYEQAVYYCQKENLRWDIEIRKKYRVCLILLALIVILIVTLNAIFQRMNVLALITILVSIAPMFSYFYSGFIKLYKDIKSQEGLYTYLENIELKIIGKKNIWDEIEELQVEIFSYRKKAYLIPTWFYKIFRKKMQATEDKLAEEISKQL